MELVAELCGVESGEVGLAECGDGVRGGVVGKKVGGIADGVGAGELGLAVGVGDVADVEEVVDGEVGDGFLRGVGEEEADGVACGGDAEDAEPEGVAVL